MRVENGADQNPRIQRHGLTGFEIKLTPRLCLHVFQECHQLIALIIRAGDVVAATEIEPFQLAEIWGQLWFQAIPCAFQRLEILFAQAMKMQA